MVFAAVTAVAVVVEFELSLGFKSLSTAQALTIEHR
jgi:hypothetical protein